MVVIDKIVVAWSRGIAVTYGRGMVVVGQGNFWQPGRGKFLGW
jgi:hypothetical protein